MNAGENPKIRRLRWWLMAATFVMILVGSVSWNIRQQRVIEHQRQRDQAAEREAAEIAAARQRKNAEWAASDARLQQLYAEIDSLSRINDRILSDPRPPRKPRSDSRDPEQIAVKQ